MPLPIQAQDSRLERRFWEANGWALAGKIKENDFHTSGTYMKKWMKKNSLPETQPLGNHLILKGLAATINGMPVDIGMPSELDPESPKIVQMLDL